MTNQMHQSLPYIKQYQYLYIEFDSTGVKSDDDNDVMLDTVSYNEQELKSKTVAQLKKLCREQNLYRSGNKATLINRLLNPNYRKNKRNK